MSFVIILLNTVIFFNHRVSMKGYVKTIGDVNFTLVHWFKKTLVYTFDFSKVPS